MKRRTIHLVFGVLSLCCVGVVCERGLRLHRTAGLNAEIARIAAMPAGKDAAPAPLSAPRELQLAQALALSKAGAHDAALKGYAALIQSGERDPVARQALFNLGNMYLRQGMAQEAGALPLFELGKQRLRDLLRAAPQDWDARYNLERALRLAPEDQEAFSAEQQPTHEQRRVRVPGFVAGDLP
ncbi:MxaK protein [Variovorax paradoxus]|uniref:MxaK protein n=1 Tax=Variovorax paradoxus TaxID=34073 RepID=A0A6I6HF45_VARPD|nr:MxaK protein [Variovorax paradoxus]QGW82064.1 MxaK protein [Variovorax paradoxus]